ncbi:hypothetical protein [Holophaga foetida]|uniref:hypothetical protein n=1 Tax=Holophaga foetida TaxID=35839 RepID=UPI0002472AC2|nr:hypothetical protein [Holophaga foetida]
MGGTDNYFQDLGALDVALADARSGDMRQVSDPVEAAQIVEEFRADEGSGAWTGLERSAVADRLMELIEVDATTGEVRGNRKITQAGLNLCGPAALVFMWSGRDPVAFAHFATELYESGSSSIGSLAISPSQDLLAQDYTQIADRAGTAGADWMILSAIRNTGQPFWQPSWVGDPSQAAAGITRPEELADWLCATGIYGKVRNEANWFSPAGIPQAEGLEHVEGRDIALLVYEDLLHAALKEPLVDQFVLNQFPNHYIVSLSGITVATADDSSPQARFKAGDILLSAWSNGQSQLSLAVPQDVFVNYYYGAVIADLA